MKVPHLALGTLGLLFFSWMWLHFIHDPRVRQGALDEIRIDSILADNDSLKARTNEYFDAYGVYPSNLECLYDATQDDNQARDPNEKFIDGPLQPDPWGNPYQIELIGDEVRITCWGPDGQVGSEDDISR